MSLHHTKREGKMSCLTGDSISPPCLSLGAEQTETRQLPKNGFCLSGALISMMTICFKTRIEHRKEANPLLSGNIFK